MKQQKLHHDTPSLSPTRRAIGATTFAILVGASAAVAQQSSATGTSTYPGAGAKSGTYNQPATSGSTSTSETTRNSAGSMSGSTGAMNASRTGMSDEKLSWSDKRFVTKAGDNGQAEVQVAQLAAEKASHPDVKSFAQKLVTDHTQANQELMSLASTKRVELDKEDATKDRAYRRLSAKMGEEFDREFVEHQIDQHESDIKLFEKAAKDAKDAEIRSFASKHVGHLREHLSQAQSLQAALVPTGRSDTTGSSSSRRGDSPGMSQSPSSTPGSTLSTPTDTTTGSTSSSTPTGSTPAFGGTDTRAVSPGAPDRGNSSNSNDAKR